jgi:hypothetical protein
MVYVEATSGNPIRPSSQTKTGEDTKRPVRATESATYDVAENREVTPPLPADLRSIVDAWDEIPEVVRSGIVAMVKAASK